MSCGLEADKGELKGAVYLYGPFSIIFAKDTT